MSYDGLEYLTCVFPVPWQAAKTRFPKNEGGKATGHEQCDKAKGGCVALSRGTENRFAFAAIRQYEKKGQYESTTAVGYLQPTAEENDEMTEVGDTTDAYPIEGYPYHGAPSLRKSYILPLTTLRIHRHHEQIACTMVSPVCKVPEFLDGSDRSGR